jgi:hypothetical protein
MFIMSMPLSYVSVGRHCNDFSGRNLRVDVLAMVNMKINIVTCMVVRSTKMTGSSSDDWIYWHLGYNLS